ncbi:SRPBCC family protein [Novosphingobium sp. M1R2S20]|uniref:SRPBCC family protein n=1 Tax=Novosphingobium rhizovicinum TaxID=3228928 RepID=A0ABV3RCQ0_9SPHN
MISGLVGAEFRRLEECEYDGQPARAVIAERTYPTDPDDLWDALTTADRIARWFAPVTGDLRLGGRYQIKGNASGTITRCDPPQELDLTWEFGGGTSWVMVRLAARGSGTHLTLEHVAPIGIMEEHWETYGPSAVGTGWDLSLAGLGIHIGTGASIDHDEFEKWSTSDEGKIFVRQSTSAWAQAHRAAGGAPETADAMAERTAKFYTGAS